jgi:hypothetical protein
MSLSDGGMALTVSEGFHPVRLPGVRSGRIYLDAARADYIRMILRCGLSVVRCPFCGTLRLCVRIECIAQFRGHMDFHGTCTERHRW